MQTDYHYTYRDFHPEQPDVGHCDFGPSHSDSGAGAVIGLPLIFTVLVFIFAAIIRKK